MTGSVSANTLKRGPGMGLSVVMGIVNNHGGQIDLVSTPGLGTTFHIYLPVLKKVEKNGPPMPNMAGIEFARRVKDLRNDLPIILCTGFLESPEAKHTDIINAVLKKPFYKEDLARVVRSALDNKVNADL